jgi:hypothetical protein
MASGGSSTANAGRVFLGRGFALFAGGPAVVYQYPALHRSAAMFEA